MQQSFIMEWSEYKFSAFLFLIRSIKIECGNYFIFSSTVSKRICGLPKTDFHKYKMKKLPKKAQKQLN